MYHHIIEKTNGQFKQNQNKMLAFRNRAAMTAVLLSEIHNIEMCMTEMLKHRRNLRLLNKKLVAVLAEPERDSANSVLWNAEMQVATAKTSLMQYARTIERVHPFAKPSASIRHNINEQFCQQLILCPICRERRHLYNTIFASCWHSVCRYCLPQYDKLTCPTCRAVVKVYLNYIIVNEELYFRLCDPAVVNPGKSGRLVDFTEDELIGRRMVIRMFNGRPSGTNHIVTGDDVDNDTNFDIGFMYMVRVWNTTKAGYGLLYSLGDYNIPEHLFPKFSPY